MTTTCFIPLLGKRLRATELNNCGAVYSGAQQVTTDGFTSISLTSEVEDGTEIIVRKASGALCVNEKLADSFKRFTVEIHFCGVNPSLLAIVSNAEEYVDGTGNVIGFTVPEGEIAKWFSLELWTGLTGQACEPGTEEASGYMLLPFVVAGVLGDLEITGEDAIDFSITGAATKGGNQWGVGPYGVVKGTGSVVNEVQTVTITGTPTGGTFSLTYGGATTPALPYNATAAAVQTALRALSSIGSTGVTVTGGPGPGTPYVVTFGGTLGGINVPLIVAVGTFTGGTTPAIAVVQTTAGSGGAAKLPTAVDPFDHLLMIETAVAPPPSACDPAAVPATE